ncbi:MAG: HipA domain-containing protein [Steroidobacteraceae bacterium]
MRTLEAFLNEQRVGTLSEGEDLWRFEYDLQWASASDAYDLSPRLARSELVHTDGGTDRPVQWYFDNLLPEEEQRDVVAKEAKINGEDAFGLLEYLGAESAGSLVLLPPGAARQPRGLKSLSDADLSARIKNLSRASLSSGAPKRMSAAGAQNKLLVVYRDGALYEPTGSEPSTHILKPNHTHQDYPSSVINEYTAMRLAGALKLTVPTVLRRYVPEPVYLVERFDRYTDAAGATQRRHIIDACQLLNKSRGFKYTGATLESLGDIIAACRNRASTRMNLYRWLIFNVLIANNDNHLKNLSFMVGREGIELSPAYDLLSTGAYHTRAFAGDRADWPKVPLAITMLNVPTLEAVNRKSLLEAGEALGLRKSIGERELNSMMAAMPGALEELIHEVSDDNTRLPQAAMQFLAGELRLLATFQHLVVPEMMGRLR